MLVLYRFVSLIIPFVFYIGSLWNSKMKKGLIGRRKTFESLSPFSNKNATTLWFHCASLGEYEQAKPLIEILKIKHADTFIAVTFFSPSGYEQCIKKSEADWIGYLPFDSPANASKFIQLLNPSKVFFIKYEFWHYYINEIAKNEIPFFLISARFNKKQTIFKFPFKQFYLNMLGKFTHIFLQDKESVITCSGLGLKNITLSGDTRIDRVIANKEEPFEDKTIELFCKNHFVVILGSSWTEEELIGYDLLLNTNYKLIIAPHEINRSEAIFDTFKAFQPVLYSKFQHNHLNQSRVLIINNVGMLSKLYRYGDAALTGGGFSGKLHNILEPAVYGLPVFFGPYFKKFPEASQLIKLGLAHSIKNSSALIKLLHQVQKLNLKSHYSSNAEKWFSNQKGVTESIYNKIKQLET